MVKRGMVILLLVLVFLSWSCQKNPAGPEQNIEYERGEVISSNTLFTYTTANLNALIALSGYNIPVDLNFTMKAVSIVYQTIDHQGIKVQASGALMYPLGGGSFPLVSLQHGTQTKRDQVASVNPLNTPDGMMGTLMGAMGYVTCVPDYLGFGVSTEMHPYVHGESLATSVIDFMRASLSYCQANGVSLSDQTFLAGYSEGGYATLATQKEIETNYAGEFDLTAVVPMAGPYDLNGTMEAIFQENFLIQLAYIAYIFTTWDYLYNWNRLDDFFKAPYASRMVSLFDGSKTWGEITSQLPSAFSQLVKESFVQGMLDGTETEVLAAIDENSLLDWSPQAPIRFYHGDADDTVPYQNSLTAVDSLTARGATVELVTIPGGTHETAAIPAIIDFLGWLESLETPTLAVTEF